MLAILAVLAVVALVVAVERWLYLHRAQINVERLLVGLRKTIARGKLLEAVSICEGTHGPAAALLRNVLVARLKGEADLAAVADRTARETVPRLERRLPTLQLLSRVGTALGVLAGLLALAHGFDELLAGRAYGSFQALARQFQGALLCGAVGLGLAVGAEAAHTLLTSKLRGLVQGMEHAAGEVLRALAGPLPTAPAEVRAAAPEPPAAP